VSLTLLLDLDDTLLQNDVETFLPRYLDAFARVVSAHIPAEKFVTSLLAGTRAMVKNRQPDCTLQEVFEMTFYPGLGIEPAKFRAIAERFYAEVFPTLKELTRPKPEAVRLVEEALKRGYRLSIVTNPLFPRQAILQRLAWAGLPADQYPFEAITSYETYHFAKPDLAFYAELMGRLGWPQGPAVMVGDDLERDILPVRRLGLPAFWISDDPAPSDENPSIAGQGKIEDVFTWLDRIPDEHLKPDFTSVESMLASLRATPATLDSLTRNTPIEAYSQRPKPGEWCLTEIFCHLRDVEAEVNLWRLEKVMEEEYPFLAGKDTDPWAEERRYILQDGVKAYQQFLVARMKVLDLLEALEPEDWERPARHAIFGPTRLVELVNIMAGHDRIHLQQAGQVLKTVLH
jgi:FMN phosphatase YigB (HAD superfamily)